MLVFASIRIRWTMTIVASVALDLAAQWRGQMLVSGVLKNEVLYR